MLMQVKEINGLGMEVMVTVWPFSHNGCTQLTTAKPGSLLVISRNSYCTRAHQLHQTIIALLAF